MREPKAGRPRPGAAEGGDAALDDAEPTREALLRAADVGLFMAKRAGRNKAVAV